MPSPYSISFDPNEKDYFFDTDNHIRYRLIVFHRPELLQDYDSIRLNVFELSFFPDNNIKPPKDVRVEATIIAYLKDFFAKQENALIVVYDSLDGRQHIRNALFKRWLIKYDVLGELEYFDFKIELLKNKLLEGQFLFRTDHPQHDEIIEVVRMIITELQSLK